MTRVDKHDLFVAVPCLPGGMSWQLALLLVHLGKRDDTYIWAKDGFENVPAARNFITSTFLQSDYKRLWFFDCDVIPSPNALEILDMEGDIVSGTYPTMRYYAHQAEARWIFVNKKGRHPLLEADGGVKDVGSVGMGCTIIKRRVFCKKMELGQTKIMTDEGQKDFPVYWQNIYKPDGRIENTEDGDFCKRAGEAGFSIRCNPDVRFGHLKMTDLRLLRPLLSSENEVVRA